MASLINTLLEGCPAGVQRPWPRAVVTPETWQSACVDLAEGRLILLGLWGDVDTVHLALLSEEPFDIGVATLECANGRFPSVGASHPPAIRLERTIRDLYGHEPEGLPDQRPWLDLGRWGVAHPLGTRLPASPPAVPSA